MLLKSLVAVVAAYVLWHIANQIWRLGPHKHVIKHHPGPCRPLEGIEQGAEDGVLLPDGRLLFTAGLRFIDAIDNPAFAGVKGQIYLFDFNHPDVAPVPLLKDSDMNLELFNPHGASHWLDPETGEVYVYVVSHKPDGCVVERFLFSPGETTLTHQKTFGSGDPAFRYLNDLVIVGKDKFYVTNMMWYGSMLELVSGVTWSSVTYFDGVKGHLVITSGLQAPNGIAVSLDSRYLYVTSVNYVMTYAIEGDLDLKWLETSQMYMSVDNLFVHPDSRELWISGHPVMWRTARWGMDPQHNTAPSQVLVARTENGRLGALREVFADDGNLLSGSSVAVVWENKMFIGSVAGKAALCELKYV